MEFAAQHSNRVLIVDDQPDIHWDFREMLTPGQVATIVDDLVTPFDDQPGTTLLPTFELFHATQGEEACDVVRGANASKCPIAVAFVDIRMPPGIDGVETTRLMRKIDSAIEIVLMTAYTDKSLPEIMHGMAAPHKLLYIRKPFSREEIQQITLSLVGKWNIEQSLAEKQRLLNASHQRLEAVLDATKDAMAMYDAEERLVFANRGYRELFGLPEAALKTIAPDELLGQFGKHYLDPGQEQGLLLEAGGKAAEDSVTESVSEQRLFYQSTTPVQEGPDITGRLVVYRDVTKEIEIEHMKAEVLHLRRELDMVRSFDGIVGDSPKMREVFELMERAVESDITVFIQGESGTGKEIVAKSVHRNGLRKGGPFVAINCAAIPETLIESELFGHEQGAFTGASRQRVGAFERAEGGTIFLDEIGDMPLVLQSKLLRVLQEREIQRVGGTASIAIDVRLISATNKDLETAIRMGDFRGDLFYRLGVFPIVLPPLRERREDIPLLANHFLRKHSLRSGKTVGSISAAALGVLLQYDWPGNVRELENAVERAVLLETTEVLQVRNFSPQLSPMVASRHHASDSTTVQPLSEMERQAIMRALDLSAHNVTEAARTLGVDRATLYRKLKKYDLPTRS